MKHSVFWCIVFIFFWVIFFRNYFIKGMVPIPGNLQVWFFSPWKEVQWPQYPGGVYKQGIFGFDTIRQIYPWRKFTTDQILKGQWPLWNPYQFSGAPHLADFQTAVFYPPNLLYLVFPQADVWTLLVLIQPLLAGLFMYLYIKQLKLSEFAAFFSAFCYSFSLSMSAWLIWNIHGHQFMYLPLILYLIEKYRKIRKTKFLFWLTAVLALTFTAGHPQIFIFILVFSGLYFIVRLKRIIEWIVISLSVLLLTAAAWLPLAQYYTLASRGIKTSEFNFERTLLPWENLLTLIAPDFLGNPTTANYWGKHDYTETAVSVGLIALLFVLIAYRKRDKESKFFRVALPLLFLLSLNWFIPRFFPVLRIPVLSGSVATRMLFLANFSLCVLAGFGVRDYQKNKRLPLEIVILGIIIFLVWMGVFLGTKVLPDDWFINIAVIKRNMILPSLVYVVGLIFLIIGAKTGSPAKRFLLFLLIPVTAVELFWVAGKIIPFTYRELVFPQNPLIDFLKNNSNNFRYAGTEGSNIESNFATYYGIFSTEGYDTLYPRYYGELVWAARGGVYKDDISRTTVVFPPDPDDFRHRLEDLMGVKYVLEKDDNYRSEWDPSTAKFPPQRYQLVWQKKNWKVYENIKVLPRAFFAEDYIVLKDKKDIIKTFYNLKFDPAKTLILEKEISYKPGAQTDKSKVEIIGYSPNEVKIKTESAAQKLLFLSDVYYPGWQVLIDGKGMELLKADYAFRAVAVPAGKHDVTFIFNPPIFRIGLLITIISGLSFLGLVLFHGIIKEKETVK